MINYAAFALTRAKPRSGPTQIRQDGAAPVVRVRWTALAARVLAEGTAPLVVPSHA